MRNNKVKMALDHSHEFLRGPKPFFFEVLKLKKKPIILPSNSVKVTCQSHFKICHHPYNYYHSNGFDELEFS